MAAMVSLNTNNTNNTRSAAPITPRPRSPPRSPPIYVGPKGKTGRNRDSLGNGSVSFNFNNKPHHLSPVSHPRKRARYSLDGSKVLSRFNGNSSSESDSPSFSLDDESSSDMDHFKNLHGTKSPFLPTVVVDETSTIDAGETSSDSNHSDYRNVQNRRLGHIIQKTSASNIALDNEEGDDNDYINPNMLTKLNSLKVKSGRSNRRRSSLFSSNGYPSPGGLASRRRKSTVLHSDLTARKRCFDYLVDAIDEAWARYCDSTNDHYSYNQLPDSPLSITDENGEYCDNNDEEDDNRCYIQDSHRLQELKERLINAKYFLESYIGDNHVNTTTTCHANQDGNSSPLMGNSMSTKSFSVNFNASSVANTNTTTVNNDITSSSMFWRRWDLIKYAAIELVEDNTDDDDIIESKIVELEDGRVFLSNE
ncbi:hypothetical protein NADFUDRAFT_72208 [Nadsonia fulvescens var. elongata DSM 6958]|uniref:Uncharacterized protein n=1 Tax=Nadsonia fulvescens var. elongata DSM 6958 TaxID=857566 RepID=A0A1E3PCF9_9ASCO|nr:hypothetical protein NADFUDRAFT_72208 [Nadsonia fulvescens var. elongata DSM 6958]